MRLAFLVGAVGLMGVQAALACSPAIEMRSAVELRAQSAPVGVDRSCRVINAGLSDDFSLGRLIALGSDARIRAQKINDMQSFVLFSDCQTKSATVMRGVGRFKEHGPCDDIYEQLPLLGRGAITTLQPHETFEHFVARTKRAGGETSTPQEVFFEFERGRRGRTYRVGRKDVFDVFCGCETVSGAKL